MQDDNKKIPQKVRLEAYEHWVTSQNISETAREFDIARMTLTKIAEQGEWQERYNKLFKRVLKNQETYLVKKVAENLKHVRFVKRKFLAQILKKSSDTKATITDIIKLMEYEDKLVLRDRGVNVDTPIFQLTFHDKLLSRYDIPKDDDNSTETAKSTIQ